MKGAKSTTCYYVYVYLVYQVCIICVIVHSHQTGIYIVTFTLQLNPKQLSHSTDLSTYTLVVRSSQVSAWAKHRAQVNILDDILAVLARMFPLKVMRVSFHRPLAKLRVNSIAFV